MEINEIKVCPCCGEAYYAYDKLIVCPKCGEVVS